MHQIVLWMATTDPPNAGDSLTGENTLFLVLAYMLLWLLVFGYLIYLHQKMRSLEEKEEGETVEKKEEQLQDRDEE